VWVCYTFCNAFAHLVLVYLFFIKQYMDNNQSQNQFPSFGTAPDSQGPSVPPPPPSQEQIGVRTMESDAESIRQSGGEQPQSQIMNATENFSQPSQDAQSFSFQPPFQAPENVSQDTVSSNVVSGTPAEGGHSITLKTILLIAGIIIVAVAVGFGVFYLVQSLNSTPEITPTPTSNTELPVATETPPVVEEQTLVPSVTEVQVPPPVQPFVHNSILTGAPKSEQITLLTTDLTSIKEAIASTSQKEKLIAGTIKDIAFVGSASSSIESLPVITALFPSVSNTISSLIDRDITAWLYGDKSGGNKLGLAIPLKAEVTKEQVNAVFASLEANPQDVLNMFIPVVKLPTAVAFKEGLISGIMVRYLAISTKDQQVFEYVPASVNGKGYLIITSSYNQMVDIIKRLNAKTLTAAAVTPEIVPVITSTSTATTSTTTATSTP